MEPVVIVHLGKRQVLCMSVKDTINQEWLGLANRLSSRMGTGPIQSVQAVPMESGEVGYSGASLFRLRCHFADGRKGSFVCKRTSGQERAALERLTLQERGITPVSICREPETGDGWILMEDVGNLQPVPENLAHWKRQVARALAGIHRDNLGRGAEMPWLPRGDEEYWRHLTGALSVDHFARMCAEDPVFANQYGEKLPSLRETAEAFSLEMAKLYADGKANTLTHGDIQTPLGDHVRSQDGRPRIIDFGFCRYAPLFIDLVDYFSPDEWVLCWEEMENEGGDFGKSYFLKGCETASRYPAFAYLFPALMAWKRGEPQRLQKCFRLLGL